MNGQLQSVFTFTNDLWNAGPVVGSLVLKHILQTSSAVKIQLLGEKCKTFIASAPPRIAYAERLGKREFAVTCC